MASKLRVRIASAVAGIGLLAVGVAVATAAPSAAAEHQATSTTTHAQPALSKQSAALAAQGLAQSAAVTPNVVPQGVSAAIASDGTLCPGQSFGATAVTHITTGTYEVDFNQVISSGVYVATVGLCGNLGASSPGFVTVVGRFGTTNALFIQTYNSAGALTDLGFHLIVQF